MTESLQRKEWCTKQNEGAALGLKFYWIVLLDICTK
jgi:hypothetical protein